MISGHHFAKRNIPNVGEMVEFSVFNDLKSGKLIAVNVTRPGDVLRGETETATENTPQPTATEEEMYGRHKGIVKTFNPMNGYGFIKWNGPDLAVFKNDIQTKDRRLSIGDLVTFERSTGRNGKDHAVDVELAESDQSSKRVEGECVEWNRGRGFGMIKVKSDEYKQKINVFCHLHEVYLKEGDMRQWLKEGETVTLELREDPKTGKLCAAKVRRIDDEESEEDPDGDLEKNLNAESNEDVNAESNAATDEFLGDSDEEESDGERETDMKGKEVRLGSKMKVIRDKKIRMNGRKSKMGKGDKSMGKFGRELRKTAGKLKEQQTVKHDQDFDW